MPMRSTTTIRCVSALRTVALLLIFSFLANALEYKEPMELKNTKILSPTFSCIGQPIGLFGVEMILWDLIDPNNATHLSRINGSVILILSNYTQSSRLGINLGSSPWAFDWFKHQGALAVVVMNTQSNQPGGNEVLVDRWDWCKDLYPMQVVEVGLADGRTMTNWSRTFQSERVIVDLPGNEDSPWRNVRRHKIMIAFQVWFAVLTTTVSVIALMKLIAFVHVRGFQISLAVVLLIIEFITNLWRLIYFSLDPVYIGRLFNGPTAHGLSTITWPVGAITMLLVGMYYQEILSSTKLQISHNVKRLQKPFIGITILIIALEIVSSSLRASRVGTLYVLVYITTGYYILSSTVLGVYFSVIGARVLRYFQHSQSKFNTKSNARTSTTKKVTRFLLGTAACAFLTTIGFILCAIPPFWTPVGHYVAWFVVYTGLVSQSLTQVLSIKMPRKIGVATSAISRAGTRSAVRSSSSRATLSTSGSASTHTI